MIVFWTAIMALCACAMLALSVVIHRSSKQSQRQMERLIRAMTTSILISGKMVGEPDRAVRLFNEQYPLFEKNLKFLEE